MDDKFTQRYLNHTWIGKEKTALVGGQLQRPGATSCHTATGLEKNWWANWLKNTESEPRGGVLFRKAIPGFYNGCHRRPDYLGVQGSHLNKQREMKFVTNIVSPQRAMPLQKKPPCVFNLEGFPH